MIRSLATRLAAAAAGALLSAAPAPGWAQPGPDPKQDLSGFWPTALEVTQLPRYCWGSFNPQFRGAGMEAFNLPPRQVCGERMNHFCPALLSMLRAKKGTPQSGYWLGVADGHMRYTLSALREVPNCPLAPEIERYAAQLKSMRGAAR